MIALLRIIYCVLPIVIGVWFLIDNPGFNQTFGVIGQMQGPKGWVKINKPDEPTIGVRLTDWLETTFKTDDTEWNLFFQRTGGDVDKTIRIIENFWVVIAGGIVFVLGLVILFTVKSYK